MRKLTASLLPLLILLQLAQGAEYFVEENQHYRVLTQNYENITNHTIDVSGGQQQWLILYALQYNSSSTSSDCTVNFWRNDSTDAQVNNDMFVAGAESKQNFFFANIYTIGNGKHVFMGKAAAQSGINCTIMNARMEGIRLDNLGTPSYNSTFFRSEVADRDNVWGDDNGDNLTTNLTPSSEGDYLLIARAVVEADSTSSSVSLRLNLTNSTASENLPILGGGEDTWSYIRIEDQSTDEYSVALAAVRRLSASQHRLTMQIADIDVTAGSDWNYASIMMVRLSDNFNYTYWSNSSNTTSESQAWTDKARVNFTGGNWTVIGSAPLRGTATTADHETILNVSGVANGKNHLFSLRPSEVLNFEAPVLLQNMTLALGEGANATVQYRRQDASSIAQTKSVQLIAIQLSPIFVAAPEDSCEYNGDGDWLITCDDACLISSNQDLDGSNLILSGSGTVTVENAIIRSILSLQLRDTCKLSLRGSSRLEIGG